MALAPRQQNGLPRVTFEGLRQSPLAPLRTDIAVFLGTTRRGPVGALVRIEGWRAYETVFGGLSEDADTGHALRGYFENGGQIAWILRLAPMAIPAMGHWKPVEDGGFAPASLAIDSFQLLAATPGSWGAGISVRPRYRRADTGQELIDIDVLTDGALQEQLSGLNPATLAADVAERSALIRLVNDPGAGLLPPVPGAGPRARVWPDISLTGGDDGIAPDRAEYTTAFALISSEPEPALLVLPDLHRHLAPNEAAAVQLGAARHCDPRLDRMVVADAPEEVENTTDAAAWIARFGNDPAIHRSLATYHPWIHMRDPVGTLKAPLRRLPPSGHVAGAISRLDRLRGPYVTPANAALAEAIDLSRRIRPQDQGLMNRMGLNALRCQSARGIMIWGGRMTRSDDAPPRFVAHRRLVHRIVRSLRRVWQPMVFEPNDDVLRFAIARSATTLLLEAFHANVLKGARPEEAFQVNIDDTLNNPATRDAGRVICVIAIAPAVPMEFIHIRVGLSSDGTIEMVEA